MRIHTNTLSATHIASIVNGLRSDNNPAERADIRIAGITKHGSKTRDHAFEVALMGNGVSGGAYGALDYKVALWDEWGIVLNALFDADPELHVGRTYESAEHFHWVTGDRYRTLRHEDIHLRHNWLSGDSNGQSAGGAYWVRSCKCGAIQRRPARRYTWSDINAVAI